MEILVCNSTSSIICSYYKTISIDDDGDLTTFSISFRKEKTLRNLINVVGLTLNSPIKIKTPSKIKMISCGTNHYVFVDFNGKLFSLGNNEHGQLGVGKDKNTCSFTPFPQHVVDIPPVDSISCGGYVTMCVTYDRTVYSFGKSFSGQLGIQSYVTTSPKLIPDLNDIEFIRCGESHVVCKTYSNEYYSWGDNENGQLGNKEVTFNSNKPIKCISWPDNIKDIKCGSGHTLLLTSTGYVYSFGSNYYGKLGLKIKSISTNNPLQIKNIPLIKRIECGYNHSMCIDVNDNLWVFGDNGYGQLGLGDEKNRYKPTLNESLHDIIDISSGGNHTFVKTINNEIYAFGNNKYYQLGIDTKESIQNIPIQVFKDNEDIWTFNISKSSQKSARK